MASISGSNILSYDYLLRNCYSANRFARKGANRASFGTPELLSFDSDALGKITKNLQEISYDKENGKQIYNNAKVFIQTYNNMLGTAGKIESQELERNMKKMKQFVKDNKDVFEAVGIKISGSGKMELDKDKMLETSSAKMQKALSGGVVKQLEKFAKKIHSVSKKLIQEEAARKSLKAQTGSVQTQSSGSYGTAGPNSIDYMA